MKKLLAIACVSLMALSLTGCSDASAGITTGKDVLFTVGKTKVTNDDIYRPMLLSNGYNIVNELISKQIFDQEVPVNDAITKEAEAGLAQSKKDLGDNFANTIKSYGYKDEEDFYHRVSIPNAQFDALTMVYLNEHAEEQIKTYKPVKAQIIECTSEENAKKALEAVQGDTSFEDAAKEHGKTDTYDGKELIVNQSSGLPSAVWAKISVVSDKEAMINEVITDALTDADNIKYYVVKVTNTAAFDEFKEDALASIKEKSKTVQSDTMLNYLKKYEFQVYDIDIYNAYKASNPTYLVQDAN